MLSHSLVTLIDWHWNLALHGFDIEIEAINHSILKGSWPRPVACLRSESAPEEVCKRNSRLVTLKIDVRRCSSTKRQKYLLPHALANRNICSNLPAIRESLGIDTVDLIIASTSIPEIHAGITIRIVVWKAVDKPNRNDVGTWIGGTPVG